MSLGEILGGIAGLGLDIVSVSRIEDLWRRHPQRFTERLLSAAELCALNTEGVLTAERLAGRWAAKEAVSKALGSGFRGFGMKDVEIINNDLGQPQVRLQNGAVLCAAARSIGTILVSISHERDYAIAQALALRRTPDESVLVDRLPTHRENEVRKEE